MKRVTYGAIASKLTGVLDTNNIIARNVKNYLTPIQYFCIRFDYPNITSIVIAKKTGKPNGGCLEIKGRTHVQEQILCKDTDWSDIYTKPEFQDLRDDAQKAFRVLIDFLK
jgi:hypothetical protein